MPSLLTPVCSFLTRCQALAASLLLLLLVVQVNQVQAQCSATSTDGYTVNVTIRPTSLVPSSTSCQYGYNYNIRFHYEVTFTGPNAPANLYTLQATFTCRNADNSSNFASLPTTPGSGILTTQSNPYRSTADCTTASVSSLDCNHVSVLIQGPGIDTTVSCDYQERPLPVTLTSFTARLQRDQIVIAWTTASEVNNARCAVEQSADGRNWQQVAYLPGAGTTAAAHFYQIQLAAGTGARYYRLRLVDTGGGATYSPVVPVLAALEGYSKLVLTPNPSHSQVTVSGLSDGAMLYVLNTLGQILRSSIGPTINVAGLPAGIYVVRSGSQQARLVIE